MYLKHYWLVLSRRWLVVVALMVIAAAVAGAYSKLQTKIYRATAVVSVTSARFDLGQGMAAAQLLSNFAQRMRRLELVTQVDDQLKLDVDPLVLQSHIKVTPTNESLTEQIDVDDSDPTRAANVATGLAKAFVQEITDQQQSLQAADRVNVTLFEPAQTPPAPNRPKTKVNTAVGAVAGLILGIVAAFALDALDDTIKARDDVAQALDLPVIGAIPRFRSERTLAKRPPTPPANGSASGDDSRTRTPRSVTTSNV